RWFEAHTLEAGTSGHRLESVLDAIAAVEAIAEGFGVADEVAGTLGERPPTSEQRLRAFPPIRLQLATFVQANRNCVPSRGVGGSSRGDDLRGERGRALANRRSRRASTARYRAIRP